jgi:outer membrane protein TolC
MILILTVSVMLGAQSVSLEQAKSSALEKNYGYAIAKENVNYSELTSKSSFAAFLPTASLSASYVLYTPEVEMSSFKFTPPSTLTPVTMTQEDRTAFGLRITQPLFSGGKIWNSYGISKDSEKASRNTLTAEMLKLIADVESQYYSVLEAVELFSIAKESLELSKRNEETAKIKFDSGLISKADYLKSSSARANSEVSLVNAEKMYELSKISFSNLTGLITFELEAVDQEHYELFILKLCASEYNGMEEKLTVMKEIATKNNNDLKNIRLSKEINEKRISISKGNFMPSVNLSYSTEWAKTNIADEYTNSGTVSLSASIPVLPLYDNFAGLEKSRIDLRKSEITEMQLTDNISTLIKSYLYTLISGSKQLSSSKVAVELASETYTNVEQRAYSGLSTEDELNTARLSLIQAKYNQASAYYSILKTKSELMKILGISDDEEIIKLF